MLCDWFITSRVLLFNEHVHQDGCRPFIFVSIHCLGIFGFMSKQICKFNDRIIYLPVGSHGKSTYTILILTCWPLLIRCINWDGFLYHFKSKPNVVGALFDDLILLVFNDENHDRIKSSPIIKPLCILELRKIDEIQVHSDDLKLLLNVGCMLKSCARLNL